MFAQSGAMRANRPPLNSAGTMVASIWPSPKHSARMMTATDTDMAMTARLAPMSPARASTNAPRRVSSRTSPRLEGADRPPEPPSRRARRGRGHLSCPTEDDQHLPPPRPAPEPLGHDQPHRLHQPGSPHRADRGHRPGQTPGRHPGLLRAPRLQQRAHRGRVWV